MTTNRDVTLVKIIADLAIFLDFTDKEQLDPDAAISALEQVAAELQLLGADDRKRISAIFTKLSGEYTDDEAKYVRSLPESLGLN